jgi:transposase
MALLAAEPVTVLPEQRGVLEQLVRTRSTPQQVALRARIILQAAAGVAARASARELGVWPKTVRYWRKRWRGAAEGQAVVERLVDAPRSGAPATFTPEQICALVAMTCEKPEASQRPISHWSQREIAEEAMRRHLIPSISQRSVGRFLKKRPTFSRIGSVSG